MRKLVALLLFLLLTYPASSQVPPPSGLVVNNTPVQGGSTGQCLYKQSNGRLGAQACGGGTAADVTVGTTTITSGTTGRILYDNAGVLGEMTTTGSGTQVALSTNPTFATAVTIPSVAWASIPAAGTAGKMVRVSNAGTKGSMWLDDGTRWKPLNNFAALAALDTPTGNIDNTETIVLQYTIPANLWQLNDRLRVSGTLTKSGTTDTGIFNVRIGTAGTTADALVMNSSILAAGNRSVGILTDIKLASATTAQRLGNGATSGVIGYSTAASTAFPAAVTISSAVSNALVVSITVRSSSTNDTVTVPDALISLIATPN